MNLPDDVHWPAAAVAIASLTAVCVLFLVGHASLAAAVGAVGIVLGARMPAVFPPPAKDGGKGDSSDGSK